MLGLNAIYIYIYMWRVKSNLYCILFNIIKTLLYRNHVKPKSVILILLPSAVGSNINYIP